MSGQTHLVLTVILCGLNVFVCTQTAAHPWAAFVSMWVLFGAMVILNRRALLVAWRRVRQVEDDDDEEHEQDHDEALPPLTHEVLREVFSYRADTAEKTKEAFHLLLDSLDAQAELNAATAAYQAGLAAEIVSLKAELDAAERLEASSQRYIHELERTIALLTQALDEQKAPR